VNFRVSGRFCAPMLLGINAVSCISSHVAELVSAPPIFPSNLLQVFLMAT